MKTLDELARDLLAWHQALLAAGPVLTASRFQSAAHVAVDELMLNCLVAAREAGIAWDDVVTRADQLLTNNEPQENPNGQPD